MTRLRTLIDRGVQFTDELLDEENRKVPPDTVFWAQPLDNWPDPPALAVEDTDDAYGILTRRTFVEASDVSGDPANYVSGSEGRIKHLDQFAPSGQTQSLSGLEFTRTTFSYQDATRPTKWTALFRAQHVEP